MRPRFYPWAALTLVAVLTASAYAAAPRHIAFQARLNDAAGAPKPNGAYSVTFRLYDVSTGGTAAWTESKSVTVSSGVFTTALGDTTALPSTVTFGDKAYWVGVQAGADAEATPRLPLLSVPYALALANVTVASDGKVGIGTTSPGYLLDVAGDVNAQGVLRQAGTPINNLFAVRNGSNATGTWPVGITGSAPANLLTGIVPIAKGGTGIATGPAAAGEYLRSTGPGAWSASPIPAGDLPGLAGLYVDLVSNQTSIGGIKNFTNKVGVRNAAPLYTLDVGGVIRSTAGYVFPDGTIQLSAGWALGGNAGTVPGTNFVGTTDNVALELAVNKARALRLEPDPTSPNVIGGDAANSVLASVSGAAISGGGSTGSANVVTDNYGVISGGRDNQSGDGAGTTSDARNATVGGGQWNLAGHAYATVAGGEENKAVNRWATVGGGGANMAGGQWATVPGGHDNNALGDYSLAAGWQANALHKGTFVWADSIGVPFASTNQDQFLIRATGGVGINNNAPMPGVALDVNGTVRSGAGGYMFPDGTVQMTAAGGVAVPAWTLFGNAGTSPAFNFIGTTDNQPLELRVNNTRALRLEPTAGTPNVIGGDAANILTVGVTGASIGGGGAAANPNTVTDNYGTVGGGSGNQAGNGVPPTNDATHATVGGGQANVAGAAFATTSGGQHNRTTAPWATVGGGEENQASGPHSTIGGGFMNMAPGPLSTIPGGDQNLAAMPHTFAAGYMAQAIHPGAFVWADDSVAFPFPSTQPLEFSARCTGGARFVSAVSPMGVPLAGVRLPPGGGAWLALSDRNAKDNIHTVSGTEVLEKLAAIPMSAWNYKTQAPAIRHMGPMAQDFHAAFGLGESEKHISTIDADGVSLAAIQGLYTLIKEKEARISALESQVSNLVARLDTLERAQAMPR